MAINCSNNAALEKLQAAKDALNAKLDALASAGTAGLAALEASLSQLEDDLKAALPELPELPNFKKELQALAGKVGKELADAKKAFKERWGDSLPDIDIDGLMDKVAAAGDALGSIASGVEDAVSGIAGGIADAFDFCKDVPNIEGEVDPATGKIAPGTVKDKGAEPTTATEPPKPVEPLKPTVVDKSKEPSPSHPEGKSFVELYEAVDPYREQMLKDLKPTADIINSNTKKINKHKKSRTYKKMLKRYNEAKKKGEIKDAADFYNTIASDADKSTLIKSWSYYNAAREATAKHKSYKYVDALYITRILEDDDESNKEKFLNNYPEPGKPGREWRNIVVEGGKAVIRNERVDNQPIYDLYIQNYNTHKQALLDYYLYK